MSLPVPQPDHYRADTVDQSADVLSPSRRPSDSYAEVVQAPPESSEPSRPPGNSLDLSAADMQTVDEVSSSKKHPPETPAPAGRGAEDHGEKQNASPDVTPDPPRAIVDELAGINLGVFHRLILSAMFQVPELRIRRYEDLARATGLSESEIVQGVNDLVDWGLIDVTPVGGSLGDYYGLTGKGKQAVDFLGIRTLAARH